MAEAHPVGFRWAMKARERGAKLIHVDPHYSRTSAVSDTLRPDPRRVGHRVPRRPDPPHHRDRLVLQGVRRQLHERGDDRRRGLRGHRGPRGLLLGLRPRDRDLRPHVVEYEGGEDPAAAGEREHATQAFSEKTGAGMTTGNVSSDETLQHPRCVFQLLKKHYSRYTPEMVERVCGIPRETFLEIAETLIANSGRERTSVLVYGVSWTQHSTGVQMIRAGAIVQLLLGNVGRPGGGIMAMRGHASIQGSSDIPTLYDLLPGYLPMPKASENDLTLESYIEAGGSSTRLVEQLRQVHRRAAEGLVRRPTRRRRTTTASPTCRRSPATTRTSRRCCAPATASVDGMFVMGQNPAVGSQHSGLQRRALAGLKWLVVRDLAEVESARFWLDSPEVESGELVTEEIQTEVFLMPAAAHIEKEGHFTNTQRLLQWRDKALDPPGDARSELHFMHHLAKRVLAHYADSEDPKDWPLRNLHWDYAEHGPHARAVRRGRAEGDRRLRGRDRAAAERLHGDRGRRHDRLRVLDLLRLLRRRRQPAAPAQPRGPRRPGGRLGLARVGLGVAGQPARALQPRVGRPAGQAVVGAQEVRLVGRGAGQVDRLRRPGLPGRQAPRLRGAGRRRGHGRDLGRRPVHHDGRRAGLAVLAERPAGRADADALRAVRVAGRQPPLPEGRREPRRAALGPRRQPAGPAAGPALPRHRLDLPAHGAPHLRPDEPQPAVARRAAAGDVRRARPGARGRARDRGRRLGDGRDRTRRDRGAGEGDAPAAAAADRRPHDPPDRPARGTGGTTRPARSASPATPPTTSSRCPATPTSRSRTRRSRARCTPAAARASRRRASRASAGRHDRDRDPPARRPAHGLLHRHDDVHRLQGLRGRLQAVERPARRRVGVPQGRLVRPHRLARRGDVAARALRRDRDDRPPARHPRRAPGRAGAVVGRRRLQPRRRRRDRAVDGHLARARLVGVHVRRLQALHERRLPRRLPDRRAHPHGVRDRRAAGRRLQRLRLLHPLVPVRGRRPRPLRRPRRQVHALLRPPRGRARAGLRQGLPDRLDPVRPLRRAGRDGQGPRRRAAREGGRERLPLRRRRRHRARAARRRAGRVLPADRAARALRAARAGGLADPGERAGGEPRGRRRRVRGRRGTIASMVVAHRRSRR